MFSSAKGRVPVVEGTLTPSTSNAYSTFKLIEKSQQDDVQVLTESDRSGSEVEVTGEVIRTKKRKKDRKSKRKKHQKNKHRRRSTSSLSSSSSINLVNTYKKRHEEQEMVDNYNFTRNVKKFGLKVQPSALISQTQSSSVIDGIYQGRYYDSEVRYFNPKTARKFRNPPKERIFRKRILNELDKFIPLSTEPAGEEDSRAWNLEKFHSGMNSEEFGIFMKSQSIGAHDLTSEEKRKLFRLRLKSNIKNKDLWEEFIELEEKELNKELQESGISKDTLLPAHRQRQIEIIKDAVKNVPPEYKFEFLMKQLDVMAGLKGFNDPSVLEFINKMKTTYVNRPEVHEYIIKANLNGSLTFKLNNVLSMIDETACRMIGINKGTFLSHRALPSTPSYIVNLIKDKCRLLVETGNIHRALAMIQAIIEYLCFSPDGMDTSGGNKIRQFSLFWESGAPRIGDDGAKGWRYTELNDTAFKLYMEEEKQTLLMDYEEQCIAEKELINPIFGQTWNVCLFWAKLEEIRMNLSWRPIRFTNIGEDYGFYGRYVGLSDFGTYLADFGDNVDAEELIFTLLRTIGVVDPLGEDDSYQNMFYHLCPDYSSTSVIPTKGFTQFRINLLRQLLNSPVIDSGRCLQAMIKTFVRDLLFCGSVPSECLKEVKLLHKNLAKTSQVASHVGFFSILDDTANIVGLSTTSSGVNCTAYDNGDKKRDRQNVVTSYLTYLNQNPFSLPANVQRQIVFEASLRLCQKLPSVHSRKGNFVINRLKFLTFLAIDNIKNFLDINALLTDDEVQRARVIWTNQFAKFSALSDPIADDIKSINSTTDIVFQLFSCFIFESTGVSAFDRDDVNQFTEKSRKRMEFRLDFTYELVQNCLFEFRTYSAWAQCAFASYPSDICIYKHLMNVYCTNSCYDLSMIKYNEKDRVSRNAILLCRIAAVYKRLQKAREQNDDPNIVNGLSTWLRRFVDESVDSLTKDGISDPFIWKFYMNLEVECKGGAAAENIYVIALANCPYSKSITLEESKNPFAPDDLIDRIKLFYDEKGLYGLALPEEAKILKEQAEKLRL